MVIILWIISATALHAQQINWQDVSGQHDLPEGLKLFEGSIASQPTFSGWLYEVDLNVPQIAIRPYIRPVSASIGSFTAETQAYGAINGGFFGGSVSYSAVVYPDQVMAQNVSSVTRNGQAYPVIRSFFGLNNDRSLSTEWIYHFGPDKPHVYRFDEPLPYTLNHPNPLPPPVSADGSVYDNLLCGIGGGPMLLKDGEVQFAYNQEVFWGSGVLPDDYRPRTAVGYTADNKVYMMVVNNFRLQDLPQEFLALSCVGAMNLDGGGSSAISLGGTALYDQGRPIPTMLAVVHTDALGLPEEPLHEVIIDTHDEGVSSQGSWFPTANPGFWGDSPSMLHPLGTEDSYYHFPLNLPEAGMYELYGWWVSHANRATDTPFIIRHGDNVQTIHVDQTQGGSAWYYIGSFYFSGDEDEYVRITAAASTNMYVVADALRLVSYGDQPADPYIVDIMGVEEAEVELGTSEEQALQALAAHTIIIDSASQSHTVELSWSLYNYDADTPGEYPATGVFSLPEGVVQSEPPTPLEVHSLVRVLPGTATNYLHTAGIRVYPNPARDYCRIEGTVDGKAYVEFWMPDGQRVFREEVNQEFMLNIDLSGLQAGVYLIRVSGQNHSAYSRLIVY